jgi:hypothetical protein
MAGNIFDQFDAATSPSPAAPQAAPQNIFDQFDVQTASLDPQVPQNRVEQFAAPQLPAQAPKPKISREGFFISEYDDGSFGHGAVTRPIVEGIKNALPAASRYQPGTGDSGALTDVIEAVLPPAAALSPVSPGRLVTTPQSMIWKDGAARARPTPSTAVGAAAEPAASAGAQTVRRMSPAELKTAAQAAYKEADEAGVIFTPAGVSRVAKEAKEALAEFGYHPTLQPRVKVALDELDRIAEGNVTFKGMDTLRKITKAASESMDASERKAGQMIVEKIDDLMSNSRMLETAAGDTVKAADAMSRARNLWARMRKTEMLEEAVAKAGRRASSTGSGGNINNATRQNLRAILDNPKKARMFTKEERAKIDKVVRGTATFNTLRLIGKLSPEGGALGLVSGGAMGMGAFAVNPLLAIPPVAGGIAKRLSDRGTSRAINSLITDVSSGVRSNALRGR